MLKRVLLIVLVVVIMAVVSRIVFAAAPPPVGSAAPEFTLTSQEGKAVSLTDYRRQVGRLILLPPGLHQRLYGGSA